MKKIVTMVASVVAVMAMAFTPLLPAHAAQVNNCDDSSITGTNLAACGACLGESGAQWDTAANKCVRPNGKGDINSIIQTVINVMLFIVGILCVIMIIFGGVRYVTSTGEKTKVDNAKNTIVYAVVGLVVAIIAFALVQWIFTSLK